MGDGSNGRVSEILTGLVRMDRIEYKETCDLINQFMQSFDLLMEKIKDLAERLKDIFDIAESDICESCEAKRTKHGSSCIAEIEATGKASIKWCEKYRPP